MVCDDEWYDSVDKVCKAVELHLVHAARRVLPHVKMVIIVVLAMCEARLRPPVVTSAYIFCIGCAGALKLALFSSRALVVHFALLYVYSVDPLSSPLGSLLALAALLPLTATVPLRAPFAAALLLGGLSLTNVSHSRDARRWLARCMRTLERTLERELVVDI